MSDMDHYIQFRYDNIMSKHIHNDVNYIIIQSELKYEIHTNKGIITVLTFGNILQNNLNYNIND